MLSMPAPTPFDLNFRVLGIPVRVSPWFWLISVMLFPSAGKDLGITLVWVSCVFVSILVHELGHGLTAQSFGYRSEIALYGMGGLCASDGEQTFWQRLAVIFAGPGAGFVLFGLTLAFVKFGLPSIGREISPYAVLAIEFLLTINLLWGLLNLLPLWPLDGGQILGTLLGRASPRNGRRWTHVAGLVLAGSLGAWRLSVNDLYRGLFCGYLAFLNYQMLQALHQSYRSSYDVGEDDADWWKR